MMPKNELIGHTKENSGWILVDSKRDGVYVFNSEKSEQEEPSSISLVIDLIRRYANKEEVEDLIKLVELGRFL